jgi:hypothetical protein
MEVHLSSKTSRPHPHHGTRTYGNQPALMVSMYLAILEHLDDCKIELQSSIDIIYYMLYADKNAMQWRMKDESVVCPANSS